MRITRYTSIAAACMALYLNPLHLLASIKPNCYDTEWQGRHLPRCTYHRFLRSGCGDQIDLGAARICFVERFLAKEPRLASRVFVSSSAFFWRSWSVFSAPINREMKLGSMLTTMAGILALIWRLSDDWERFTSMVPGSTTWKPKAKPKSKQ